MSYAAALRRSAPASAPAVAPSSAASASSSATDTVMSSAALTDAASRIVAGAGAAAGISSAALGSSATDSAASVAMDAVGGAGGPDSAVLKPSFPALSAAAATVRLCFRHVRTLSQGSGKWGRAIVLSLTLPSFLPRRLAGWARREQICARAAAPVHAAEGGLGVNRQAAGGPHEAAGAHEHEGASCGDQGACWLGGRRRVADAVVESLHCHACGRCSCLALHACSYRFPLYTSPTPPPGRCSRRRTRRTRAPCRRARTS